jgi:hypothetical protein
MANDADRRDEEKLDETIEESFPASDPPANTPETGIQIGRVPSADAGVLDNTARHRLELVVDGQTAFLDYQRTGDTFTIVHTEVPPELRGRRIGDRLVEAALHTGRAAGLKIVVICPFARAYLRRQGRPPE